MIEGCLDWASYLDWARYERGWNGELEMYFSVPQSLSVTTPHPLPVRVEHSRDTHKAGTE